MRALLRDTLCLCSLFALGACGDGPQDQVREDPGAAISRTPVPVPPQDPPLDPVPGEPLDLCGGLGTACCPGGICLQGQCNEANICAYPPPCGNAGQACCAYGVCYGTLECNDNGICRRPCGGAGEACCAGGGCDYGLMCNPNGFCRNCGSLGDNCCNGLTCGDGLTCRNNTCVPPIRFPPR